MRWRALFADLEGQLAAAEDAEHDAEVADRTRREHALVRLPDRLAAAEGDRVGVALPAGGLVTGVLADGGADWLLVEEERGVEVLVRLGAVLGVTGLGRASAPARPDDVGRRLDLRWALRGLARSRTPVALVLVDGSRVAGTVDRVGADHLDLAEHPLDEPRRAAAVRQVRTVPLAALAAVRSRA